jgi:predicted DNA-binding transcriptional regulator YafY
VLVDVAESEGMDSKARTVRRAAQLLASLMAGEVHDRKSAARLLGVKENAAYVVLRALEKELAAVEQVHKRGGFRFDFAKAQPISAPLAIAASFARTLADLFGDGHHARNLKAATDDVIRRSASTEFEHIERKLVFMNRGGDPSVVQDGGMLNDIVNGVLGSKKIQIRYQSRKQDKPELRVIWPLSLIIYDHQFYVLALKEGGELRVYRMSRVTHVIVLEESFPYPTDAGFDPRIVFEHTIGVHISKEDIQDVIIHLTGEWATVAQTHLWHKSQQIQKMPGGKVKVRWRLRPTEELESLVLSFGAAVEVVTPISLRERVRAAVMAMAEANRGES